MRGLLRSALLFPVLLPACERLDRFDTSGDAAYCGNIVAARFVWTPDTQGGFSRTLRLGLDVDADRLSTAPGTLWSDDAGKGPCGDAPTFDHAALVPSPELASDPLSTFTFEEGQVHNVVAWVTSSCGRRMLAIVSLYKTDRAEVRLLEPGQVVPGSDPRDVFARFTLNRSETGCGY